MTRKAPVVTKRKRATGGIKFPLVSHDSIFKMRPCSIGWRTLVSALGGPVAMKKMGEFNPMVVEETNHQGDLHWLISSLTARQPWNTGITFDQENLDKFRRMWKETQLNAEVIALRHKVFMKALERKMK